MKKLILLLVLSSFLLGCSNLPTDTDSTSIPPEIISKINKKRLLAENLPDKVSTTSDLWERIRQGHGSAFPENARIQKSIKRYLGYSSYFSKLSTRAEPYLYYIVNEIEKRKMPMEIAFLPAIESFYNPKAYSHMGASGMWQFIATTGKLFHLKRTRW